MIIHWNTKKFHRREYYQVFSICALLILNDQGWKHKQLNSQSSLFRAVNFDFKNQIKSSEEGLKNWSKEAFLIFLSYTFFDHNPNHSIFKWRRFIFPLNYTLILNSSQIEKNLFSQSSRQIFSSHLSGDLEIRKESQTIVLDTLVYN